MDLKLSIVFATGDSLGRQKYAFAVLFHGQYFCRFPFRFRLLCQAFYTGGYFPTFTLALKFGLYFTQLPLGVRSAPAFSRIPAGSRGWPPSADMTAYFIVDLTGLGHLLGRRSHVFDLLPYKSCSRLLSSQSSLLFP